MQMSSFCMINFFHLGHNENGKIFDYDVNDYDVKNLTNKYDTSQISLTGLYSRL